MRTDGPTTSAAAEAEGQMDVAGELEDFARVAATVKHFGGPATGEIFARLRVRVCDFARGSQRFTREIAKEAGREAKPTTEAFARAFGAELERLAAERPQLASLGELRGAGPPRPRRRPASGRATTGVAPNVAEPPSAGPQPSEPPLRGPEVLVAPAPAAGAAAAPAAPSPEVHSPWLAATAARSPSAAPPSGPAAAGATPSQPPPERSRPPLGLGSGTLTGGIDLIPQAAPLPFAKGLAAKPPPSAAAEVKAEARDLVGETGFFEGLDLGAAPLPFASEPPAGTAGAARPSTPPAVRPSAPPGGAFETEVVDLAAVAAAGALPFAKGAKSVPPPSAMAEVKEEARDLVGETGFSTGIDLGERPLPFAAPQGPAPGAPREADSRPGVALTLEQYASVGVDLDLEPSARLAVLERYGLDGEAEFAALDASWRGRARADASLGERIAEARRLYLAWRLRGGS